MLIRSKLKLEEGELVEVLTFFTTTEVQHFISENPNLYLIDQSCLEDDDYLVKDFYSIIILFNPLEIRL